MSTLRIGMASERGDYGGFYRALAAHLHDGSPVPVDPRSAVDAIRVIEAVLASTDSEEET